MRLVMAYEPPYKWGGSDIYGVNCSGLIYLGAPEVVKLKVKLKRSTSDRMEQGLDGWIGDGVGIWDVMQMDLGFTDGHVVAVTEKRGLLHIIHSRSSRGPTEEPMPSWVLKQKPRFKRLTIGD